MFRGRLPARLYGVAVGTLCILTSACANEMASGPGTPDGLNCDKVPQVALVDPAEIRRRMKDQILASVDAPGVRGGGTAAVRAQRVEDHKVMVLIQTQGSKGEAGVVAEEVARVFRADPKVAARVDRFNNLMRMATERVAAKKHRTAEGGRATLVQQADSVDWYAAALEIGEAAANPNVETYEVAAIVAGIRDDYATSFPLDTQFIEAVSEIAVSVDTSRIVGEIFAFEVFQYWWDNYNFSMSGACGDTAPYAGGQKYLPECPFCTDLRDEGVVSGAKAIVEYAWSHRGTPGATPIGMRTAAMRGAGWGLAWYAFHEILEHGPQISHAVGVVATQGLPTHLPAMLVGLYLAYLEGILTQD